MIGNLKIGIIGGGQLGKMLTLMAKKMGFYVNILDPTPNCPAAQVADKHIVSDFFNSKKIKKLVQESDVTTFEIERADKILIELADKGHQIYPSPHILNMIQNKAEQKEFFKKNKIPTPDYKILNDSSLISVIKEFSFPVVQKSCKSGYDGRGVFVIKNKNDIKKSIQSESYIEEFIDFEKELAIIVVKSIKGDIKCYPVVEMVFDKRANICDMVIAPARISNSIKKEAERIGVKTVNALGDGAVGVFGIEMFLTKQGKILVNEIAPRPHNSGHYTIEACVTSQFENHLRAIANLPLGSTELFTPAVMVNILGKEGYEGLASYKGVEEVLKISGLSLHIYGKHITRPFRKMGHITIVDKNINKAIKKAEKAKKTIKVTTEGS